MKDPEVAVAIQIQPDGLTPRVYAVRELSPAIDEAVSRVLALSPLCLSARRGDGDRGDECGHEDQCFSLHV